MSKLEVKMKKTSEKLVLEISGTVDEDVDFFKFNIAGCNSIELDLGKIKSINSCGIREWIKWIRSAGDVPVVYSHCAKVIVDQINMVDGFLPLNGKVTSFYVPYYNEDSGTEKNVLFQYGKEFSETGVNPPEAVVDSAGHPMEMDVIETKYFKFLNKK